MQNNKSGTRYDGKDKTRFVAGYTNHTFMSARVLRIASVGVRNYLVLVISERESGRGGGGAFGFRSGVNVSELCRTQCTSYEAYLRRTKHLRIGSSSVTRWLAVIILSHKSWVYGTHSTAINAENHISVFSHSHSHKTSENRVTLFLY